MLTKLVGWLAQFTPIRQELEELERRRLLSECFRRNMRGAPDVALVLRHMEARAVRLDAVDDKPVMQARDLLTELQKRALARATIRAQRASRAEFDAYTRGSRIGFQAGQQSLQAIMDARDECDALERDNARLANEVSNLEHALHGTYRGGDEAVQQARQALDLERARLDHMAAHEAAFVWPNGPDGECFMVDGDGAVLSGTSGAGGGPLTYADPRDAIDASIVAWVRTLHPQERAAA